MRRETCIFACRGMGLRILCLEIHIQAPQYPNVDTTDTLEGPKQVLWIHLEPGLGNQNELQVPRVANPTGPCSRYIGVYLAPKGVQGPSIYYIATWTLWVIKSLLWHVLFRKTPNLQGKKDTARHVSATGKALHLVPMYGWKCC